LPFTDKFKLSGFLLSSSFSLIFPKGFLKR